MAAGGIAISVVHRTQPEVRAASKRRRWRVEDRGAFLAAETKALYDHGIPEPIIACHRLKVLFAVEDELAAAPRTRRGPYARR